MRHIQTVPLAGCFSWKIVIQAVRFQLYPSLQCTEMLTPAFHMENTSPQPQLYARFQSRIIKIKPQKPNAEFPPTNVSLPACILWHSKKNPTVYLEGAFLPYASVEPVSYRASPFASARCTPKGPAQNPRPVSNPDTRGSKVKKEGVLDQTQINCNSLGTETENTPSIATWMHRDGFNHHLQSRVWRSHVLALGFQRICAQHR